MQNESGKTREPQIQQVGLADLAGAFNVSPRKLELELARLGWGLLMNEAERLAHADFFAARKTQPVDVQSLEEMDQKIQQQLRWGHLLEATQNVLPDLRSRAPARTPQPKEHRSGYLYVLFDGTTGLSKIGCTRENGSRQRAIMGAHGTVLINVLNAKVADRRAAEAQCHARFQENRTNGEWFQVGVNNVMEYIATEVTWESLDIETPDRLANYIEACRGGDTRAARLALLQKVPR